MKKYLYTGILLGAIVLAGCSANEEAVEQAKEEKMEDVTNGQAVEVETLPDTNKEEVVSVTPLTVLDSQGVSYLTTEEYLQTPSGLPIYKTELFYTDLDELQQQPEFFEFTKNVEGRLYKGTLKLYQADKQDDDSWKAMYSGVISRVEL
ncbi:hypothetical protein [Paenisporosarcina quisquiliarum]|uniref:hypothetical protein n=1 Tax=Paenisporosarcina quisquiliarum TaxID=365346 RepID=UPI0037354278